MRKGGYSILAPQNLSSQVMKGGIAAKRYYFGS